MPRHGSKSKLEVINTMNGLKKLFGDIFVAVGAAFLILSVFLAVIFMLSSLPEANPYVAALVSALLFGFFIAGGVLFFVGVVLERRRQT